MIKAREGGDASASPMQRNAEQAVRSRLQPIGNLHRQTLRADNAQRSVFVIQKIRHKGLKLLYRDDRAAKVNPDHADTLRRILGVLDQASTPEDVDLPGFRLHALKGEYDGFYAVQVSGNWRVIFRFEGDQVTDVDYLDYH